MVKAQRVERESEGAVVPKDRRLLKLLRKWLKAGVLEDGHYSAMVAGTPQGGVISPLLSNIYLHYLDTVWERQCADIGVLVRRRLHRFMVKRRGRNLRAGQAEEWTRQWFWDKGLHRLKGTVRYPKPCMLHEKTTGKPYAGNPHVRFERRRVETGC